MSAQRANSLNGSDWLKNSFSIWRDFRKDLGATEHPAPFPLALATRLIECYASDPCGVVLDPFAGSGTTLIAALRKGMKATGFDINPDYRILFEQRISLFEANGHWNYEVCDARRMSKFLSPGSVEICITSPPYWNILNRRRSADRKENIPYSANAEDIGNLEDYNTFLDALGDVASGVGTALRPGGYFVLNVMDIRKGPNFYPLHQDASTVVAQSGELTLDDIIIWDRQSDYNSMRPLGYPYKFIINKVHEYLLVFRKAKHNGETSLE